MKRVVLCRPMGPRNVGTILRVAENFGPLELALVAPERPSLLLHPEFVQMSHGAEEARDRILVYDDLEAALGPTTHAVGFTARVRGDRVREEWGSYLPRAREIATDSEHSLALVFGNEERGLTREEVDLCHDLVHIRTSALHTSLNLGMSVGIVLSQLFVDPAPRPREPGGRPLNGDGRAFLKARLREVLVGEIARSDEASRLIEAMIERVFSRAPLENRDAKAWHLVLKALGSELRPDELGLEPNTKGGRRRMLLEEREAREAEESREDQGGE